MRGTGPNIFMINGLGSGVKEVQVLFPGSKPFNAKVLEPSEQEPLRIEDGLGCRG